MSRKKIEEKYIIIKGEDEVYELWGTLHRLGYELWGPHPKLKGEIKLADVALVLCNGFNYFVGQAYDVNPSGEITAEAEFRRFRNSNPVRRDALGWLKGVVEKIQKDNLTDLPLEFHLKGEEERKIVRRLMEESN